MSANTRRLAAVGIALLLAAFAPTPSGGAAAKSTKGGKHEARVLLERARPLFGTALSISAEGLDSTWTGTAIGDAFDAAGELEATTDPAREDGELARLNAAGAERRVECSSDLFAVLDSSLAIARATEGAFDPTLGPLVHAWDLRGAGRVPDPGELADARERAGWNMVEIARDAREVRFRRDGMALDFGGIERGFALDRAAGLLRSRGMRRALLRVANQQVAFTDGEAWVIDIPDPIDPLRADLRLVLRRGGLSTCDQTARFETADHQSFGRVLDPRTGRPVTTRAAVTVVAASATTAQALSNALLVMGRDRARAFIESRPDLGAVWLERDAEKLYAWRWNLPTVSAESGVVVEWMP